MRKLAQTSTALLLGSAASTAMAAGVATGFGDARLYWRMSFDESAKRIAESSYSFVVDYDRRFGVDAPPVPAAQVNFDRRGLLTAYMNGVPFAHRVTLMQTEGGSEAAAGTTYTAVDYGLLALGAAGIGYGIYSVVDQKDTRDAQQAAGPAQGPAAGPSAGPLGPVTGPIGPLISGPLGPVSGPLGPLLTGPLGPVTGPLGLFTAGASSFEERAVTPEYQQWLDDGTGGMGDLIVIK